MAVMGVPGLGISSTISPRRMESVEYTPPAESTGTAMSAMYIGCISVGAAVYMEANMTRRAVERIWPMPRWMASAWSVTSRSLNTQPRTCSSHSGPLRDAHWKPELTDSLISFRYCTARVASMRKLGPFPSGAKPQSFLGPTSVASKSYFSARYRACSLASLGAGMTLPSSISICRSMGIASASMYRRLCLLGDLERHVTDDLSDTVSR
mmetsp:Transcript_6539/g.8839  ORF Transcript_6539/g.8839 Transcript_6539/m.8839 type:complete len:209 (+) Transcript_6539:652-1278(+)